MKTVVTRNGQLTLSKKIRKKLNIRPGSVVEVHRMDNLIYIEKTSKDFWDNVGNFLPKDFNSILKKIRHDETKRLKKLGVI